MKRTLPAGHPANRLKTCPDCNKELSPENFPVHKHPRGFGGYSSLARCHPCNKAWKSRSHLLSKYKLTLHQYDQLLKSQGGKCAICGSTGSGSDKDKFVVDHDHETSQVRGLLCWPCNIGLGMFKDKPELINKVVDYLAYKTPDNIG